MEVVMSRGGAARTVLSILVIAVADYFHYPFSIINYQLPTSSFLSQFSRFCCLNLSNR